MYGLNLDRPVKIPALSFWTTVGNTCNVVPMDETPAALVSDRECIWLKTVSPAWIENSENA